MSKKLILVLGGSTFMGKHLLKILKETQQYQTIYINRGKKYWNGDVKKFTNLNYYYGNRKQHEDFTKLLKYLNKRYNINPQNKWAAIVDFSAFRYPDILSVKDAVQGLTDLYLFISTDSIYDIYFKKYSSKARTQLQQFTELTPQQKQYMKKRQEYGYNKLKCQMFLYRTKNIQTFPFISLILPDVIGPFDDTSRFWAYVKWIQRCDIDPVLIDSDAINKKMSLVYSIDVADLIFKLIKQPKYKSNEIICKSYNLAFDENPTLAEFIKMIASSIKKELKLNEVDSAPSFYPSVDFGFLQTSKAKQKLDWKPSTLKQAIERSSRFFVEQASQYKQQERQAQKKLKKKIHS